MDLTYTDASWHDLGMVTPLDGDFAYGADENDFAIDFDGDQVPPIGGLLYAEGSDVGGMVTGYSDKPEQGTFQVTGVTWTGLMGTRVLRPDDGQACWSVSGDARDCAASLLSRLGLGYAFVVDASKAGVTTSRTFSGTSSSSGDAGRYMDGWAAMWQLVSGAGCSVRMRWDESVRRVRLTVSKRAEWTGDEAQDAGVATVGVTVGRPVNHLLCLGKGEGAARTVIDLYADASGAVSRTQTLTGRDEVADVYDDSGADDESKLESDGRAEMAKRRAGAREVSVACGDGVSLDLGDLVGGTARVTGVTASAVVAKKVATFTAGAVTWSYKSGS